VKATTKFFITVVLATGPLVAIQEAAFAIDPAQTKVEFTLGDVLHTVHGTFSLKRGTIRFNETTGKADGELVVDAASGNSGSNARDSRMHKDILESGKYPEIVFKPDHLVGKVAMQGTSQVQLHGIFSIHGGDHEMLAPLEVQAAGGAYTATVHFTVPYVKWGLKNPSNFVLRVSDKVEIVVHTVAKRIE
jgi:polyisoprenoid-binding protein YceI